MSKLSEHIEALKSAGRNPLVISQLMVDKLHQIGITDDDITEEAVQRGFSGFVISTMLPLQADVEGNNLLTERPDTNKRHEEAQNNA